MGKKHHFVPQFYLKAFVDPNSLGRNTPYLWVADLHGATVGQRSVKNVACITGFYDWKELGNRAPSIEPILSQIEGRTATIMSKLRNGDFKLTEKERYYLSIFLGLQLARTPRFRKAGHDALVKYALEQANSLVDDNQRLQKSLDEWNARNKQSDVLLMSGGVRDFVKNKRFNIVPNPDYILGVTIKAGLELSELIFLMRWLFVLSAKEACFFTCDVPVALLTPDAKPRKVDFKGFQNPEIEISFPISPSCMLLLRNRDFPESSVSVGDDVVNEINRRIFPVVDRYVFCSSEQQGRWALAQRVH
ncbi:MAG: DUF4238 domain-containing protein [Chloroflexi bacterium]|nr:DUF4238 domain-containing protein [Chloroflexota bacterium]